MKNKKNDMKWISFKKKTPRHLQQVISCFMGLDPDVGIYTHYLGDKLQERANKKGWGYINVEGKRVPATSWMPMPKPPRTR